MLWGGVSEIKEQKLLIYILSMSFIIVDYKLFRIINNLSKLGDSIQFKKSN